MKKTYSQKEIIYRQHCHKKEVWLVEQYLTVFVYFMHENMYKLQPNRMFLV